LICVKYTQQTIPQTIPQTIAVKFFQMYFFYKEMLINFHKILLCLHKITQQNND